MNKTTDSFLEVWNKSGNIDFVYGVEQLEVEIRADERKKVLDAVISKFDLSRTIVGASEWAVDTRNACTEYLKHLLEQMKGEQNDNT